MDSGTDSKSILQEEEKPSTAGHQNMLLIIPDAECLSKEASNVQYSVWWTQHKPFLYGENASFVFCRPIWNLR